MNNNPQTKINPQIFFHVNFTPNKNSSSKRHISSTQISSPALKRDKLKILHLIPGQKSKVLKIIRSHDFQNSATLSQQVFMVLGNNNKINSKMAYRISLKLFQIMFSISTIGALMHIIIIMGKKYLPPKSRKFEDHQSSIQMRVIYYCKLFYLLKICKLQCHQLLSLILYSKILERLFQIPGLNHICNSVYATFDCNSGLSQGER